MSQLSLTFAKISKKDVAIAGGKGASLGEMTSAKIPVPPGFVLLADAFERFLEETDLNVEVRSELKKVNYKDINSVDKASNVIRDLIHDAKMPEDIAEEVKKEFKKLHTKLVAVRSSATAEDSSEASWAGELETYLNTTEKNLLENVKQCWSSLFTPRAIFYRFEKGMKNSKVSVAVVVQKMIESELSGITFTVHPITKDKNQMIIETGYGLGEAIVSGQITPDSHVLSKKDLKILDINISKQERMIVLKGQSGNTWKQVAKDRQTRRKMTDGQLLKIAKLCIAIEKHYKKPQDIEWAFAKGKFYITQSRPITTL